jgi:ABC-2 type transport system permease protein
MTSTAVSVSLSSLSRVSGSSIASAFIRRDFSIARSYRLPFILDGFYGVLQLAVYYFISETFSEVPATDLQGAPSYFAFAAVGAVMGLIVEAAGEGMAFRVREEQLSGSLEALVAQPLTALELCVGFISFPAIFAAARTAVYLFIAALWMDLDVSNTSWIGLVVMFVTSITALAWIGILAGALVLVLKRGEVLAGMVLFAMTLLGGSIFPISTLPDFLAAIGRIVPVRFSFDGVRDALFVGSGWEADALALLGFTAVGFPLAVWLFGHALHHAQRAGSLAEY